MHWLNFSRMRYMHGSKFRLCDVWALLAILMYSCFVRTASGDPQTTVAGQFCGNSLAISGSVFAINFVPSMENLSTAVTTDGYGTSAVGQGPNAVFGLGQCIEDLNPTDCELCFSEVRSLLPKCYPNTTGRLYLDGCFGRYANYSFFNDATDSLDQNVCTTGNNSASPDNFGKAVRTVIGNVTTEAIRNKGYAVGSASVSNTSAYALAQCWQNLTNSLCSTCLNAAASSIVECLPAVEGRALFAGCYMRYSTALFWNVYQNGSSSSGTNNVVWIVLGSVLGVLFVIFGILVWKKTLLWKKAKSLRDMYREGIPAAISQSSLTFKYEDMRKATGNFSLSNKLGQGSYGTVYKAVLSDGKEAAVKRLLLNTRQWVDQFFNEVNLISQVRHKNLVKLLGCSVDGPESLLLYEYYANRSLDLFLFDSNHEKNLVWEQRIDIVQGVAEGLSYLHEESETRIIHRDIKASNILLDDKFKPKITDFGLARALSEEKTHLTTGIAGTLGYMAPEYVVHGHLTEKADVYSYGVLVLEIVTGKRCGSSVGSHAGHLLLSKVWNHYKNNTIEEIVDERIYDESAKEEIMHVIQTGLLCTQANPGDRPTMAKVVELLRKRRHDWELILNDPPFFDIETAEYIDDREVSQLLSSNSAPNISRSSLSQFGGR